MAYNFTRPRRQPPPTSVFTPAPSRAILWPQPAPLPLAGGSPLLLPVRWPQQAAATGQDSSLDLTAWLAERRDTLVGVGLIGVSGDAQLGAAWVSILGARLVAWLSGGTPGTDYVVTLRLTTAQGRAVIVPVSIYINTDSAAAAPATPLLPPNALVKNDGTPLCFDNGSLILI